MESDPRLDEGSEFPTIVEHVLNVPYSNPRYPRLVLGGYTTQNGTGPEEHAIVHTVDIQSVLAGTPVLLRLNSACYTGDVFHDELCDCNWQLHRAVEILQQSGEPGLVIYHLNHEGKGVGWTAKLRAYRDKMFAVEGDRRDFRGAVAILRHLGITRVRLMTNNPGKQLVLQQFGIEVVETVSIVSDCPEHGRILDFKREKLGHRIPTCTATG